MSRKNPLEVGNLSTLLKENDLWLKDSMEGSFSLMRAISSSLFFTEQYHEKIQRKLVQFFCINHEKINFKFQVNYTEEYLLEQYVENAHLHEFESINLELASFVFNKRFKIYFELNSKFCSEMYYQKKGKDCKLFRINSNNYSAVFSKKLKKIAIFSQNIILNLIERMFDKSINPLIVDEHKKFINFDLEKWKVHSGMYRKQADLIKVKRSSFPSNDFSIENEKTRVVASEQKDLSSVGEDLIQLFQRRKCKSANEEAQEKVNFAANFISPLEFLEINPVFRNLGEEKAVSLKSDLEEYSENVLFENEKLKIEADLNQINNFIKKMFKISTSDTFESGQSGEIVKTDLEKCQKKDLSYKIFPFSIFEEPLNNNEGSKTDKTFNENETNKSPNIKTLEKFLKPKSKGKLKLSKEFVPEKPRAIKTDSSNHKMDSINSGENSQTVSLSFSKTDEKMGSDFNSEIKSGLASVQSSDRYLETIDAILYEGKLKFFDQKSGFGFLIWIEKGVAQDLFVYKNEFVRAKIPMEKLRQVKNGLVLNFTFQVAHYVTKNQASKKAINLRLVK